MTTSKLKILILEDDESVGAAIEAALARAGHEVFFKTRPSEGLEILSSQANIDFLICDCLLPQMTGLDFIMQARAHRSARSCKVILMSGIYNDKQFIQEAVQATQAVAFLKKPFEISEVLKIVGKASAPPAEDISARKSLYQIFSDPNVTLRQKRKVIDSIEELCGYDLPFLYSLLAEMKSNGYLNVFSEDGSISGLSFCQGDIVAVDVDDEKTFLGTMLIQSGYVGSEELQEALLRKANQRLGSYLISNNMLSPHAFEQVLLEQMNLRLASTLTDKKVRVNFATSELEKSVPAIDSETLNLFLHDWIASKITTQWLKAFYASWTNYKIVKSPNFRENHPCLSFSLIRNLDGFVDKILQQKTLGELLATPGYNEAAVYKAIHLLLVKGLVVFASKSAFSNAEEQLTALHKIWSDISNKNPLEAVSFLEQNSVMPTHQEALQDFLVRMGECSSDKNSENYKMWQKIKSYLADAVETTRESTQVGEIREAQLKSQTEALLRASTLIEEVKKGLPLNQFAKSLEQLNEIAKLNPKISHLYVYLAWAKLGLMDPTKKASLIKEIEMDYLQIPPDERYDATYSFVTGLICKAKEDLLGAQKAFERSIALDSAFMPARRELSTLQTQLKKTDIFNMDLKDVVSALFKKR